MKSLRMSLSGWVCNSLRTVLGRCGWHGASGVLKGSQSVKSGTVTCVRSREALKARAAGTAAALACSFAALAFSTITILETNKSPIARGVVFPSETNVLGDVVSLADVVSNTYERKSEPKSAPASTKKPADMKFAARSGLTTTKPVTPPPGGLLGLLFGPPVAEPELPPPATAAMPARTVAYTTMCVRLCDGSYFPVSYATTRSKFGEDQKACDQSCDAPSKLFVFETVGGSVETMEDVRGNPYKDLATAFQFRVSYDPSCKCRAHPWEQEAQDRHRKYADLAAGGEPGTQIQSKKARRHSSLESLPESVSRPSVVPNEGAMKVATSAEADVETGGVTTAGTSEVQVLPAAKVILVPQGIDPAAAKSRKFSPATKMQLGMTKPSAIVGTVPEKKIETQRRSQTADDVFRANFAP